ncbi:MAG: lactate utilization protein [bacterium]|nr:lactate utilization protein [bacterium]
MSEITKKTYALQAQTIIKALERRNMKGYYCDTCYEAVALADSLIEADSVVSFGGSMTLGESGVMEMLKSRKDITLLDRSNAKTPEEASKIYHDALNSDVYFMSSNAITLDGELVNIDGTGNRVAALIYGPEKVVLIVGMNKVVPNVDDGIRRVHNIASPANCVRLNRQTPCGLTGVCHDCLSPDCICSQTVITRRSGVKDRIQVILVGEKLGY